MNTGTQISAAEHGSWILYGLEPKPILPGFVVLTSVGGGQNQPIASRQWHSGFLLVNIVCSLQCDPVLYLSNPNEFLNRIKDSIDSVNQHSIRMSSSLTRDHHKDQSIRNGIPNASVPDFKDVSKELKHILDLYGAKPGMVLSPCAYLRRLAEKVRFIHLYHRGWDHHGE